MAKDQRRSTRLCAQHQLERPFSIVGRLLMRLSWPNSSPPHSRTNLDGHHAAPPRSPRSPSPDWHLINATLGTFREEARSPLRPIKTLPLQWTRSFTLAIRIDAKLDEAYSRRGYSFLHKKDYPSAKHDFT